MLLAVCCGDVVGQVQRHREDFAFFGAVTDTGNRNVDFAIETHTDGREGSGHVLCLDAEGIDTLREADTHIVTEFVLVQVATGLRVGTEVCVEGRYDFVPSLRVGETEDATAELGSLGVGFCTETGLADGSVELVPVHTGRVEGIRLAGADNATIGLLVHFVLQVGDSLRHHCGLLDSERKFTFGGFGCDTDGSHADRHGTALDTESATQTREVKGVLEHLAGVHNSNGHGVTAHIGSTEFLFDSAVALGEDVRTDIEFDGEVRHQLLVYNLTHSSVP